MASGGHESMSWAIDEDELIRRLQSRLPADSRWVELGVGDDAAVLGLAEPGRLLISTDSMVESVHFRLDAMSPRFIGRKALATAASDIAAMGGELIAVLLSLHVGPTLSPEQFWDVVDGFVGRLGELSVSLVGGNLSRNPHGSILDTTVLGVPSPHRTLTRSGASEGDAIYVTGQLGASAAGRLLMENNGWTASQVSKELAEESATGNLLRAHLDPEPKLSFGQALAAAPEVSACLDLSDGLVRDLPRLCRQSGLGARVDLSRIPMAPGLVEEPESLRLAIAGGEDYELLYTAGPSHRIPTSIGTATRIGVMTSASDGVVWLGSDGEPMEVPSGWGWDSFLGA